MPRAPGGRWPAWSALCFPGLVLVADPRPVGALAILWQEPRPIPSQWRGAGVRELPFPAPPPPSGCVT